ncbi:MAG: hypothetical protein KBT20_05370 [Bacteroidales bacterium]|nr:hypothetical protein [Candidatus Liminaster caballi]
MKQKLFKLLFMLVLLLGTSVVTTSCDDDNETSTSQGIGDYYVEFSVDDKGTLSASEASQMAGELNSIGVTMDNCTREQAEYYFDTLLKSLVDNDVYSFEVTFKASLMLEKKVIKSKKLQFSRNGCRVY